jgi:hypothetical protein
MNPLVPTGYDLVFMALIVVAIALMVIATMLVIKQDVKLFHKFLILFVFIIFPIMAPSLYIFLYLKRRGRDF